MPELNLRNIRRDLRLPELRLPEMSRDDIAKALGEARKEMREVRKDFDDFRRDFELPKVDVPTADVGRVDASKVTDGAKQVADGAKQMADTAKQGIMQAAEAAGLVTAPAIGRVAPTLRHRWNRWHRDARDRLARAAQLAGREDPPSRRRTACAGAHRRRSTVLVGCRRRGDRIRRGAASRRPALDIQRVAGHADSPYADPPTELPDGFGADGGTHRIEEDAPARA